MRRWLPLSQAIIWSSIPLFPAFIALAAVSVPGVSLIPRWFALALLGFMVVLSAINVAALLEPPREAPGTLFPLLGFFCAAVLAAALGFNPAAGIAFLAINAMGIVWHVLIVRFYRDPKMAGAIFWSFLITGTLASVTAIVMVWLRWPANQYTIVLGRAVGTFILPGELAGYLIVFLAFAFAIARESRGRALRTVAWAACAVGAATMVLTYSRAGWIGLAAAAAFYIFATRERGQTRYAIAAIAIGFAAVLLSFDAHHNPSENFTRLSIWQAAGDIIARFPLTGVGPFDFATAYGLVRQPDGDATAFHAHNMFLTIFAEMGIVGFSAAIWVGWAFVRELGERLATASPLHRRLALAATAGVVGTLVQGLIDTVSVVLFALLLPTMALALAMARDGLGEGAG